MSTIIECPACLTRYKMNKAIPEGGRHVKCARCGNQWRLVPEGHIDENIEAEEAEYNPDAHASRDFAAAATQPDATSEPDDEPSYSTAEASETPSWQARRDRFSAAIPSLSDANPAYDDQSDESEEEPEFHSEAGQEEEPADGGPAVDHSNWSTPSFMESYRRAAGFADEPESAAPPQTEVKPEPEAAPDDWTQMNRTWRDIAEPSQPEAEEDDEDAEAAIREALKKALENPDDGAQQDPFPEAPKTISGENPRSRFGWASFMSRGSQSPETPDDDDPSVEADETPADDDMERRPFTIPGHDPADDDEIEDEEPFRLTGGAARRPVYGSAGRDEDDVEEADEAAAGNLAFQHDIEDAFRAGPLPKRPFEPLGNAPSGEELSEFDRLYDGQGEAEGADEFDSRFYEDEAAALEAQLASTDIAAYQNRRGAGGLAVAAGWAIFLSVFSGIALGLVSFRQEIMTALPGTASLYSAIGFKVRDASVDFADVSYRWTETEGKPMIEVRGQVVNVTDRKVRVPRVLINVRDAQSTDTVKATATVQTETLEPRQKADFTLEFVSPPKNISQIELEFDANR